MVLPPPSATGACSIERFRVSAVSVALVSRSSEARYSVNSSSAAFANSATVTNRCWMSSAEPSRSYSVGTNTISNSPVAKAMETYKSTFTKRVRYRLNPQQSVTRASESNRKSTSGMDMCEG
jgi:hypothetical protein